MSEQQQQEQSSSGIIVYISRTSGKRDIKKNQQKVLDVLDAKKIPYEVVDISSSEEAKDKMRAGAGEGTLPPQIFKCSKYLGNFEDFEEAVEDESINKFLELD